MRAKLAGTKRVVAVLFTTYPRPIPPPGTAMVPAAETCQACHWPGQFAGDRLRRIAEYADDEASTETVTTLQLHVGGGGSGEAPARGIHWHADPATEIDYVAPDAETISYVRVRDRSGEVREYFAEGVTAADVADAPTRRMDCIDCHNRPGHPLPATAERAVNGAMFRGAIPRRLPFVHREAVRALSAEYPTEEAALEGIATALHGFYAQQAPLAGAEPFTVDDVARAVGAVQDVARTAIFPRMAVKFGTYPNQLGHTDAPGCFRCHDDSHTTTDGRSIGQDCETCHAFE
jgi:hypothetical protein